MMGKKRKIIPMIGIVFSIAVVTFFETGCVNGNKVGDEELSPSINNLELLDQIGRGDVNVEEIINTGEGLGTIGEVFSIPVTNASSTVLEVELPCGLVFTPNNNALQPMMVIQKETASIDPGETINLSPYVVCIDADTEVPEAGDNYTVGYMESGDLLSFAECLCKDPDTTNDPWGVQFAIWMVSEDLNSEDVSDYFPDDMKDILENELGMSDNDSPQTWLERCGIK